ncbi:MAG TPA: enolase C-terminal domain-like protein [Gemmatimonadaceae bacterium]|nr:enolase C-terminal domain-like protein [Gemmatimonadaceae bacterium]
MGATQSYSVPLDDLTVRAYRVPTDTPNESDGTFVWNGTTLVVVHAAAGGATGLGYTYANVATATLIRDSFASLVRGMDVLSIGRIWRTLVESVRNVGRTGIASMAISAVDTALWDLKARLLSLPLVSLLGATRESAPVYGSGGFTSYTVRQLCDQLAGWVESGIPRVKMKIGRDARADVERVAAARAAIGDGAELFVDANGAYERKQALAQAERFAEQRVTWFEEPVYHRDLRGLRFVREHAPPGMEISVGEYGYAPDTFASIVRSGATDVLQADASRCEGITGLIVVDGFCDATATPLSTHCAPSLHAHVACAAKRVRHVEYFHDHARIEQMLFDGVLTPRDGALHPDLGRHGLGLELKQADALKYEVA